MEKLHQTASQTVGPYFSLGMPGGDNVLAPEGVEGERIRVEGRVVDGHGQHVEDSLLEIWQANAAGRYRHPDDTREELSLDQAFTGFARVLGDFDTGEFWFETIKPGLVPDPEGMPQAPHINLIIQARGMLNPLFTRIYFSDEQDANEKDFVLNMVPEDRRSTLVAQRHGDGEPALYRFDIRLQGDDETVFFDV